MAVTGKRGVGIPTILLHDGEGTIVSIEMKTGETYRGLLDETEDNMNCVMKDAVRTDINGNTTHVEQVYLRGSQILFIVMRRCSSESSCGRNTRDRYRHLDKEDLVEADREDKLLRSFEKLKNGEVGSKVSVARET
ncbi:hypothetical protein PHYBOEH_005040 [Phytophthora boehmeriae]|uniref:Small nuclear ribonucleoprotein Sm D3 n=1 Tax=Phytophthora boehmeriae TaxID=109152 RepID=A0A8T1WQC6_9STRA|nr:hypothetical protein PHYBOEH_005040 [Phytophthora boehmeriae]